MNAALVWLMKAFISHLLTDFILQPTSWVEDRKKRHFSSVKLYLHGAVKGIMAWIFLGNQYWVSVLFITISHTLIDGWKSYRKDGVMFFLIDQALHLVVILGCWFAIFAHSDSLRIWYDGLHADPHSWSIAAAAIFLTTPAGILIGKLTRPWRDVIEGAEGLANAGKWIGIIERLIVLVLIIQNQYSAMGLLVAAKGIIRFSEKDRQETKTEYLVIGTLLSIGIAIITAILTTFIPV